MYRTDKQFMRNPATASARIYVGNLAENVKPENLEEQFSQHGRILGLVVQRGFGFIQFEADNQAQSAIMNLNGFMFFGKKLNVKHSIDNSNKPKQVGPGGPNIQQNQNQNNWMQNNQKPPNQYQQQQQQHQNNQFQPNQQFNQPQQQMNMNQQNNMNQNQQSHMNQNLGQNQNQQGQQGSYQSNTPNNFQNQHSFPPTQGNQGNNPNMQNKMNQSQNTNQNQNQMPKIEEHSREQSREQPREQLREQFNKSPDLPLQTNMNVSPVKSQTQQQTTHTQQSPVQQQQQQQPPPLTSIKVQPPPSPHITQTQQHQQNQQGPGSDNSNQNQQMNNNMSMNMNDDQQYNKMQNQNRRKRGRNRQRGNSNYGDDHHDHHDQNEYMDDMQHGYYEPSMQSYGHGPGSGMGGSSNMGQGPGPNMGPHSGMGSGMSGPGPNMGPGSGMGPGSMRGASGLAPRKPPVDKPERNDCEIIVVAKALTEFAEYIEQRLKDLGLIVDLLFPNDDVPIGRVLANISSRGCLYAILVMPQNEDHRSMTLNILHGIPEEHRNMPIDDALLLITRNFDAYMRGEKSPADKDKLSITSKHPEHIQTVVNLLAENRQLTTNHYDKLITYLQEKREMQLKFEVAEGVESGIEPETKTKQTELQNRIMNILNKKNDDAPEKVEVISTSLVTKDKEEAPPLLADPSVQKALDSLLLGEMFKNLM